MIPFYKVFELSKKLSKAILDDKSLHDVETSEVLSDDAKKELMHHLSDTQIKANLELLDTIDTQSGWEQIEHRISADTPKQKKQIPLSTFYKVAALILLFISTGYFLFNDPVKNSTLQEKPIPILTGTDKAVLTLENGTDVVLEKGRPFKNGSVIGNGEQLVYSKINNNNSEQVYNYLTVPRGGQYHIVLSDSTMVWLNASTKIKYPLSFVEGKPRNVELVYGEAYFKVSPSTKNQGSVFKVTTNVQEIEVLGTEFNVKAYKEEYRIYTTLVEGSINIDVAAKKHQLSPGEQSIVDTNTKHISKHKVTVDYDVAWVRGYFNFKNKPLREIMTVLSRWYDVDIAFKTQNLENIQFSGLLNRRQNIEDILDGIKNTKFINAYEIKNKEIIIK